MKVEIIKLFSGTKAHFLVGEKPTIEDELFAKDLIEQGYAKPIEKAKVTRKKATEVADKKIEKEVR